MVFHTFSTSVIQETVAPEIIQQLPLTLNLINTKDLNLDA